MKTITLTNGLQAMVDDEDHERVVGHTWGCITSKDGKRVYAQTRIGPKKIGLHRFIMSAPRGYDVDHVNMDTLDCRKVNLRVATRSQNMANSRRRTSASGFKGVFLQRKTSKWVAQIKVNYKPVYLGTFVEREDAAKAYDKAARLAFGEFASLNFPRLGERGCL